MSPRQVRVYVAHTYIPLLADPCSELQVVENDSPLTRSENLFRLEHSLEGEESCLLGDILPRMGVP